MKGLKVMLGSVIALGVLAGSVVGATAQEVAAAPVEFTARWTFGPDLRIGTETEVDGVGMGRGGAWRPQVISRASDPRLEGDLSIADNYDEYADGPTVHHYAFRIENEDGVWQQLPTINLETGDGDLNTTTGVLIGEGGYEGLIAVFDLLTDPDLGWTLHGYIFDGDLPPAPEPYMAE